VNFNYRKEDRAKYVAAPVFSKHIEKVVTNNSVRFILKCSVYENLQLSLEITSERDEDVPSE